jgi:uncharacterized protein (DUF885 family)
MCKLSTLAALLSVLSGCSERSASRRPDAGQPAAAQLLPPDDKARLDLFVKQNLDAELAYSPSTATWLGAHGYDDRIDDVGPFSQAREVTRLRQLLEELRSLDDESLDPNRRIDRLLLTRRTQLSLADLTELKPLERNPVVYLDLAQGSIAELVADELAAPPERLRTVSARLWKLRPLFDEARRNLRGGPTGVAEVNVRKAIELGQGARSYFAETLPKALQLREPKLMDDFRAAEGDATRALDDFVGWLTKDLLPRAKGDPALGRDRLVERWKLQFGIQRTPEELVALAEHELKESRRRYDEAQKALTGGKPGVDLNKLIEDDHGKPDELQQQAQAAVESMIGFIRTQKLATLPDPERPKVLDMPPAAWGFSLLSMAGPLAPPRDAYLYIDPIGANWPERRKQEHLRAFNRPVMVLTLIHDVVGHFLEAERNRRAPTTMQKISLSLDFLEGWPHYVEKMMLDEGYAAGDLRLRIAVERSIMLRAARLSAVVKLHALSAKLEDVVKLFTDEALLDDFVARREAERALTDPLVAADALGRLEIERLRDDWRVAHPDATLGAFHDALLAHGSPPVYILRRILLPGDGGPPL